MDNYELNLRNKMLYIKSMVSCYLEFSVTTDFFKVAVVRSGEIPKKQQTHGYGTTFELKDLRVMYKSLFISLLSEYKLICKETKRGIHFKSL